MLQKKKKGKKREYGENKETSRQHSLVGFLKLRNSKSNCKNVDVRELQLKQNLERSVRRKTSTLGIQS